VGPLHYIDFDLCAAPRERLAAAARSCRSTINLVAMAAHHIALAVVSGGRDVTAKTIVSGRDTPELLDMVGYTADCLPLRATIDPRVPFAEFVQELQRKFALACRHRVKWELVEEAMQAVGAGASAPVFNFVFDGPADPRFDSFSVKRAAEIGSGAFNMSHGLTLLDTGQAIRANVKYMPLRHESTAVESFVERFSRCLAAASLAPFAPVARLMES
jgi:non-ribosomal peptide synthetase component F